MTPLKLGMVGGGQGAFIGAVHRIASRIDGQFDLVAGALASDPDRANASAAELGISPERSYASYAEMAKAESERQDGIDAVSIVTPNHLHGDIAEAFLAHGIHVICEKPMTATLEQARSLAAAADKSSAQFFLTHNYTGYPMVRQARQMIAEGVLGNIRMVQAEYLQDWLSEPAADDNKQADWRTDPARAGGGAIGDIGTHAFNLLSFVSGLTLDQLSADLRTFVPNRKVDDDARISLRFAQGAYGHVWASQVAIGNENNLTLRISGDRAGLSWSQENPNYLSFTRFGEPTQTITRGGAANSSSATQITRIPPGHPEGYLEAFATIYTEAAEAIRATQSGTPVQNPHLIGLQDGLDGVRFVHMCQTSSAQGGSWVSFDNS